MRKPSIRLQDLRRKIYLKAKAENSWRFWGLFVHIFKIETLNTAYLLAKKKDGAPGIDGVTFEAIEEAGVEEFLKGIQNELKSETYYPMRNRRKAIPKGNGKERVLGIPSIKDRVVQGAVKLILEPIFEADFQEGSYGYRPNRTAQAAVKRIAEAVIQNKVKIIDIDLKSYFDNIRHDILLKKVAERVRDDKVMKLLKLILKANGKRGLAQGGVISPLLANIYLNEVDKMLEKAKEVTRKGKYTHIEYVRYADDMVALVDGHEKWNWLLKAAYRRLIEEVEKLDIQVNIEKTRIADLVRNESFSFLGFDYRRMRTRNNKIGVHYSPKITARTKILNKLKNVFRKHISQPIQEVIKEINPIIRGWVNYFRIGNSNKCFRYVKEWIEEKVRRHLVRSAGRQGFGWKKWSSNWIYKSLGLYNNYSIRYNSCESVTSQ